MRLLAMHLRIGYRRSYCKKAAAAANARPYSYSVQNIISLPCPMYERRRLHELSTGNLFCSPPVLPF